MTSEFLIETIRTKTKLRDQALIMIKQQFSKVLQELNAQRTSASCLVDLSEHLSFLSSPEKVSDFFNLMITVFNEENGSNLTNNSSVEMKERMEFCQA